ncbi:MAG: hypothetical protein WB791_06950 [Waddliaceae bacterium]
MSVSFRGFTVGNFKADLVIEKNFYAIALSKSAFEEEQKNPSKNEKI